SFFHGLSRKEKAGRLPRLCVTMGKVSACDLVAGLEPGLFVADLLAFDGISPIGAEARECPANGMGLPAEFRHQFRDGRAVRDKPGLLDDFGFPIDGRRATPSRMAAERLHCRLAGVTRQSAFRCGAPSSLSFRVLKRTTAPGTRLRALIRLRPVPVKT